MTLFRRFWAWLQRQKAPLPVAYAGEDFPINSLAALGRMSQDQFPDLPGELELRQARGVRVHELYRRVIAENNACVERGMGRWTELVAYNPNHKRLTDREIGEMATYEMGVVFKESQESGK